jgi:hypothetical protein
MCLILVGLACSAMGFVTVAKVPETLAMDAVGFAGLMAIGIGIVLVIWKSRSKIARGFEVKLTPSMTPGLIEEKEE